MSKDYRTDQAKKWPIDYIPPETCGSIDAIQNAQEHLRDANSQLRHVAHFERHRAEAAEARANRMEAALKDARGFISNGIEFGFIRMPKTTNDLAHKTLPNIEAALASLQQRSGDVG